MSWERWTRRVGALVLGLTMVTPAAGARPLPLLGRYVVLLDSSAGEAGAVATEQVRRRPDASLDGVYPALNGYVATFRLQDITKLLLDPRVRLVEPDRTFQLMDTQAAAPSGLDRIDQANLPLDGKFTFTNTGAGVTAYEIDSGIRFTHSEFEGRAGAGADFVNDGQKGNDCYGHGTHVAGIIGGKTYGVAKKVKLVGVRVFGCDGSTTLSTLLKGIDWVTRDHKKPPAGSGRNTPAVVNMSLGGGPSATLDQAVTRSIKAGLSYVLAAGNGDFFFGGQDACRNSPARISTPGAMTVGAVDSADTRASFSNYGKCVDWFAPGVGIQSAWYTSDTATATADGTSMAAPFTTGAVALYLQAHPAATPAQVEQGLRALSQSSAVVQQGNSANNHLLYTSGL
jgi:subtilisin family serine protease